MVYQGRKVACKYLFQSKTAKENRKFWDSLREISDSFREFQNQAFSVELLRREAEKASEKSNQMRLNLEDLISKAAMSYVTLKNPAMTSATIFKATQTQDPAVEREVTEAHRL